MQKQSSACVATIPSAKSCRSTSAHCEISKPKFVQHASHHPGYDKKRFSAMKFFVNGLPPFSILPKCLKCEHRGVSIAALAEQCHEFHTDKQTSSSRPLTGMTSFLHADVSLREELDNMQNELATLVLEATKLKNEKKRRQLHPECYGVAHLVSLRGDVVIVRPTRTHMCTLSI